jgi:hypothetical protein
VSVCVRICDGADPEICESEGVRWIVCRCRLEIGEMEWLSWVPVGNCLVIAIVCCRCCPSL